MESMMCCEAGRQLSGSVPLSFIASGGQYPRAACSELFKACSSDDPTPRPEAPVAYGQTCAEGVQIGGSSSFCDMLTCRSIAQRIALRKRCLQHSP